MVYIKLENIQYNKVFFINKPITENQFWIFPRKEITLIDLTLSLFNYLK